MSTAQVATITEPCIQHEKGGLAAFFMSLTCRSHSTPKLSDNSGRAFQALCYFSLS